MTDALIIQKAIEEIENKTLGVTEQFLEIHQIVYDGDKPKVNRIDRDKEDGTAIVYFPVKDEKFYWAVYVDTIPEVSVRHAGTESYNSVYFRAMSETYSYDELANMTVLMPTKGRNKGDQRGGTVWKFSSIILEPNREADEFEDKLTKLLDYLEQDIEGINQLVDKADGYVQVAMEFHNGNGMLGGPHIDKSCLQRLVDLNLKIDFDLYAGGEPFK